MDDYRQFLVISQQRMYGHYRLKLERCIEELDEDQLWMSRNFVTNSIGGIILHACALIEAYVDVHVYKNHSKTLQGIENYFPDGGYTKEEVLASVTERFNTN